MRLRACVSSGATADDIEVYSLLDPIPAERAGDIVAQKLEVVDFKALNEHLAEHQSAGNGRAII